MNRSKNLSTLQSFLAWTCFLFAFPAGIQALELPLPAGWRNIEGIRQGPEGSYAVFGPFPAESLDKAVFQRLERVTVHGTAMVEKKREKILTADGFAGLKIVYEVAHGGPTYVSPYYFFMPTPGTYYVIKTIPNPEKFQENAGFIEKHILKNVSR